MESSPTPNLNARAQIKILNACEFMILKNYKYMYSHENTGTNDVD